MEKNHFHPEYIADIQQISLTKEEILKGNKLFLRFMDFDDNKSPKWIIECALYDRSWDELMKVALKILSFWTEEGSELNSLRFEYKHLMFHQVMDFNFLYRRTMRFVEKYYQWLPSQG